MISPKGIAELVDVPPIPMEFFEIVHNLSMFLLIDDKHDLGRTVYYNRNDHYYHGHHSPHHPSPYHHWQIGLMGLLFSQIGPMISQGLDMYNDYRRMEEGDIEGMDPEIMRLIKDDNALTLQDYKDEISGLPIVAMTTRTIPAHQADSPKSLPGFPALDDLPHFPVPYAQ
jgi:hypothetical protein